MTKRTDEETWVAACEDLLNWEEENDARLPGGMTEEWRAAPGTDGWYDVSSLGRVRSWHTKPI